MAESKNPKPEAGAEPLDETLVAELEKQLRESQETTREVRPYRASGAKHGA